MQMKNVLKITLTSVGVAALAGCSSFPHAEPGAPTMMQSYQTANHGETHYYPKDGQHQNPHERTQSVRIEKATLPKLGLAEQTQKESLHSTLNSQFPKLPNPQFVGYVFGHYAGAGQIPVPGYFTTVSLYNRDYYALPDEVLTPYNDGQFK